MNPNPIRFDDGASYEQMMGRWSQRVGEPFLAWIAPPPAALWVDVGCGNGAFTEQIVERCAPAHVQAIDPSEGQLAYARKRLPAGAPVTWREGDAMRLPLPDASADVAVMALVLFFVPDPATGVAEMARVVRPGGRVAAYHWDIPGGGLPLAPIGAEMRKMGIELTLPPSMAASTLEASQALWHAAGLEQVEVTSFTVTRTFEDFRAYWDSAAASRALQPAFEAVPPQALPALQERVRQRLGAVVDGPVTVSARANAVRGVKPAGP